MAQAHVSSDKKGARENRAVVLFEDEAFFQQEGTLRRTWAKRGKGVVVLHHPVKRRSKFFGALSIQRKPRFVFRKAKRFNARTFQHFLEDLLGRFGRVCLILDNVSYHKARTLKPFLRANRHRLWLYSLPKYSPELNPVEMVWRETRKDATHNRHFPTTKRLTRAVQSQFRTYQREPERLAGIVRPFLRL